MVLRSHVVVFGFLATLLVVVSLAEAQCPAEYSFALLSDVHIGDSKAPAHIEAAINKINSMIDAHNIKFVFTTGDLTNTAYYNQYTTVLSYFNRLKTTWIPIIGNHDTWIYNDTFNEKFPTGDTLYAKTFSTQLNHIQSQRNTWQFSWENAPVHNPVEKITSWFTNWELRYCGAVFYGLDWNSRQPALNLAGYKGAWPGAELHNFTGGTFQYLNYQLGNLKRTNPASRIYMLHHHPFRAPFPVPDFIYGFSGPKKQAVSSLMQSHFPRSNYWGLITGHWHRWYNGTALDDWPELVQWETESCKDTGALALAHVRGNTVTHIDKLYGNQ